MRSTSGIVGPRQRASLSLLRMRVFMSHRVQRDTIRAADRVIKDLDDAQEGGRFVCRECPTSHSIRVIGRYEVEIRVLGVKIVEARGLFGVGMRIGGIMWLEGLRFSHNE